jgi:hypothetical protein
MEVRGNPFAVLQSESLESLADDIKLQVGSDIAESKMIFDNLIDMEKNVMIDLLMITLRWFYL